MLSTGTLALALGAAGYGAVTGLLLPRADCRLGMGADGAEEHRTAAEPELGVRAGVPEQSRPGEQSPPEDRSREESRAGSREEGRDEGPEGSRAGSRAGGREESRGGGPRQSVHPDRPGEPGQPSDRGRPAEEHHGGDRGLDRSAGWEGVRGRSGASARTPSGWGYALSGAVWCAAVAAAVGFRPELVVWLLLLPCWLLLAGVDWRTRQLPDVLTLPLAGAAPLLLGLAALAPGAAGRWPDALVGGLGLGGAYFVLFLIHPDGMGFGDVKLALSHGAALGWYGWPVVALGGFLGLASGAVYGVVGVLLIRRAGRKATMPLGPFMVLGALLALMVGGLAG